MKLRDCVPSPNTVIGSPASAWRTKVGTTIPYWPVCRGPTVLKNRTMIDRQLALLPVGEREELVDRLAARVGPAVLVVAPITRSASSRNGTSVLLPYTSDVEAMNDQLLLLVRVPQDDLGAVDVGLDRVHRLLDDQLDADRGREVEDDVGAVDQLRDQRLVVDRVDRVLEARRRLLKCAMLSMEPVDRSSMTSPRGRREQRLGEMRADEAGAAGDETLSRGCRSVPGKRRWRRPPRRRRRRQARDERQRQHLRRTPDRPPGIGRGWYAANAGCCGIGTG